MTDQQPLREGEGPRDPGERVIDWMRRRAENGADLTYALGQFEQAEAEARATAGAVEPRHFMGDDCTEEDVAHFAALERGAAGAVEGADPPVFALNDAWVAHRREDHTEAYNEGCWPIPCSTRIVSRLRATTPEAPAPDLSKFAANLVTAEGTDEEHAHARALGAAYLAGRNSVTPEAPAAPPSLDVERLARAMAMFRIIDGEHEGDYVHLVHDPTKPNGENYHLADPREFAERIAAEYAALASAAPSEPGE